MRIDTRAWEVLLSCRNKKQTEVALAYAKLARAKLERRHSSVAGPLGNFAVEAQLNSVGRLIATALTTLRNAN